MTASDTIKALERSLITEAEALEQALCDSLDALYQRAIFELAPHLQMPARDRRTRAW